MDHLITSKELGFENVPSGYIPDLERGCLVEIKTEKGERFLVLYKIILRGKSKFGNNNFDRLVFINPKNPDETIGFIDYSINQKKLIIEQKTIYITKYEKKGLVNTGTSLLADYTKNKFGVDKLEGTIKKTNPQSERSRVLVRDLHTNKFLPTFRPRFFERSNVITYLTEGPTLLQRLTQRRLHL